MKSEAVPGPAKPISEEMVYDGTSTHEVSSSNLSPAERNFFQALRASLTTEKRSWLKVITDAIKDLTPQSQQDIAQDRLEEQRSLEQKAQNYITHVVRTASQKYFYDEALRLADTQVSAFENKAQIRAELEKAFEIENFNNEIKVEKVEGTKARHKVLLNDDGYEHDLSHRTSVDLDHEIQAMQNGVWQDKTRQIVATALANCRAKIDVFDDAVNELGSEASRQKLAAILGKNAPKAGASPEMVFYMAWQSGNTTHANPIFKNSQDIDAFSDVMAHAWKSNFFMQNDRSAAHSDGNIDIVARRLAKRIANHDQFLSRRVKQPPQPKAVVSPPATAPQAEAASKPEPLDVKATGFALDKASNDMMWQLAHHSNNKASAASNVKTLVLLIVMKRLVNDPRVSEDEDVKTLATLMLSSSNIMATAKALEADAPLQHHRLAPAGTLHDNAKQISQLYTSSDSAHAFIDEMMQDERVMLLATLTLGRDQSKKAITAYLDNASAINKTEDKINERLQKIEARGLTEAEMLKDTPGDIDAFKLTRDRAALEGLNQRTGLILRTIEDGVRRAMNGERGRDIVIADIPPLDLASASGKVPEGWKKDYATEFRFDADPKDRERHFILSSREYPGKNRNLTYNAGAVKIAGAVQSLREECEYHRCNLKLIAELAPAGFAEETLNGVTALRHKESGIAVPLDMQEEPLTHQLTAAKQQLEAYKREQLAWQTTAPPEPQAAAHANGKNVTGKEHAPDPFLWQPAEGETLIFFDSATLKKFTPQRGDNGHTWLDLIKATSRLPNVRVVIPEVIADWEMQGRVPVYDKKGHRTGSDLADTYYAREGKVMHHDATAIRHFLKGASYGKLQEDGSIALIEGENRNIIVVNTPGDKRLYARIREAATPGSGETLESSVHKRGEGEKSIDRIVGRISFKAPVVIISDDLHYLRDVAPRYTGAGSSVAHVAGRDYFNAEAGAGEARAAVLARELNDPYPLNYNTIAADSLRHTQKFHENPNPLLQYCTKPVDPHTRKANNIYSLVQEGTELVAQGAIKNGNGMANGSRSWVDNIRSRSSDETGTGLPG